MDAAVYRKDHHRISKFGQSRPDAQKSDKQNRLYQFQTNARGLPVASAGVLRYDKDTETKGVSNRRTVRSVLPMQTAKAGYIVISAVLGLLGIFLMRQPDVSTAAVGTAAGVLLVIFGIIRLIGERWNP